MADARKNSIVRIIQLVDYILLKPVASGAVRLSGADCGAHSGYPLLLRTYAASVGPMYSMFERCPSEHLPCPIVVSLGPARTRSGWAVMHCHSKLGITHTSKKGGLFCVGSNSTISL